MTERRASPRRQIDHGLAAVRTNSQVQVLEISASGVLLRSTRPIPRGTEGTLRLNLGGAHFSGCVRVRRVSPAADNRLTYLVGGAFVGLSPDNAQLLTRFITQ